MRRRRPRRRFVRRTAAPHATPRSFRVEGNIWRVGVVRSQLIPVNSVLLRAYWTTPPRLP